MSKVLAVAWREFKYTALTKAFIIGGVIFPLVIWAAFPVIMLLTQQAVPDMRGTIAIVDPTGEVLSAAQLEFDPVHLLEDERARQEAMQDLTEGFQSDPAGAFERMQDDPERAAALSQLNVKIDVAIESIELPASEQSRNAEIEKLKQRVRAGDLLAFVTVDPELVNVERILRDDGTADTEDGGPESSPEPSPEPPPEPSLDIYTSTELRPVHFNVLRDKLGSAVVRARAERVDYPVDGLRKLVSFPGINAVSIAEGGVEAGDTSDIKQALPFVFCILITISAFSGGQYLLTTTIEEKSNKVMEVLLSAISPLQLMVGKILGQAFVSLVMLIMYGGLGIAALIAFATADLIDPMHLVYGALFFIIAYFVTGATMASVGSAVSDMHDAQALMMPAVMMLMIIPMLLMFPASQDPNGVIATAASFIPPFIPYVMMVRVVAEDLPAWQIILSILIGFGSVFGAMWMAAKIFRVGVLMQGKPPTPLQMLKWVRYS